MPADDKRRRAGPGPLWAAVLLACVFAGAQCRPSSSAAAAGPAEMAARPERAQAAPPSLRGEALLAALPARRDIALRGHTLIWTLENDAQSHRILEGRPGRELWVEVDRAAVRESWALADPAFAHPLSELEPLLSKARSAGLAQASLRLEYLPLLEEVALVSRAAYVVREGVLRGSAAPAAAARSEHRQARRELQRAIAGVQAELPRAGLGSSAKRALELLLERVDEHGPDEAGRSGRVAAPRSGEPPASALRRLLRNGWLEHVLPALAGARALTAALERAERPAPVVTYRGPGLELDVLEDAFGTRVRWVHGPRGARYARSLPEPAYVQAADLTLVVDLPAGASLADDAQWTVARVFHGELELAAAQRGGAFSADPQRWQRELGVHTAALEKFLLPDALPPHILLVSGDGDPRALVTRYGVLEAPRDAEPAALEHFLATAARVLPDAAHLDLLGERLHAYTYDSPDPARPELIGTAEVSSDIHQTALETLAHARGGMLYGDCDDLSELYETIASRQGHLAHMIGLPAHAATAWSERQGNAWSTYVLQTGPPLAFSAQTSGGSVQAAYHELAGAGSTTGDQLEVLLRFAGENTRDSYFLSERIFADSGYARSMIELQQDWHDWTLYHGARKIAQLIERGDRSAANQIELAAFQASMLQYETAARGYRAALEKTAQRSQRIYLRSELAAMYFELGRGEPARAEVRGLLEEELRLDATPDPEDALEPLIQLAQLVVEKERDPGLALEILVEHAQPIFDARRFWYRSPVEQLQLDRYMRVAIRVLEVAARRGLREEPAWSKLSAEVASWFEDCAFEPSELATSPLDVYALLGDYYRALKPDALEGIRAAAAPDPARVHTRRAKGDSPIAQDFAWIAISPQFWWGMLEEVLQPEPRVALDRGAWLELAHRTRVARARAAPLGLDRPELEERERLSDIATALLRGRSDRLRSSLAAIAATGDRALADEAADLLARIGRRLPEDEFAVAIDVALAALPLHRLYFRIAWRCAADGEPGHALIAARKAAAAFADEPVFADEYARLRAQLGV